MDTPPNIPELMPSGPPKKKRSPNGRIKVQVPNKPVFRKALELLALGQTVAVVAKEVAVAPRTLENWLAYIGGIKRTKGRSVGFILLRTGEFVCPDSSPFAEACRRNLQQALDAAMDTIPDDARTHTRMKSTDARREEMVAAREGESERMMEVSQAQTTPGDTYQAYMAAQAVRLIRDGMADFKPPRTVKELEILDGIARRNLGLSGQGRGSGAGRVQLDISILADSKADRSRGSGVISVKAIDVVNLKEDEDDD
jgi:hypothetical protein